MAPKKGTVRVRVPQSDGEIVMRHEGNDPVVYPVQAGIVEVDEAELQRFLRFVAGAEVDPGSPGAKEK